MEQRVRSFIHIIVFHWSLIMGMVCTFMMRAKGIVAGADGKWIHFDYVPGTPDVRTGSASTTGRLCVIGSHIQEDALAALFRTC